MGLWNIDGATAIAHNSTRVGLALKPLPRISNILESAISTIPNAKESRIFELPSYWLQMGGRTYSDGYRLDLGLINEGCRLEPGFIKRPKVSSETASVPTPAPCPFT